ncbi:MAG: hypothetical protein ABI649_03090 [Gaiellaceae bacterium]
MRLSDLRGRPVVLYFYPRTTPRGARPRRAASGSSTRAFVSTARSCSR